MKFDPDRVLLATECPSQRRGGAPGWRVALPLLAAAIASILAIYWDTARSMIATWGSSQTFAHGYLVVPIVLSLAWMRRHETAAMAPRPDVLGFVVLAGAGLVWLAA